MILFFQINVIAKSENQANFVTLRINELETFFSNLCSEFVAYTRRTAKLRNNGDEIVRILSDYAIKEKINRTTSSSLKEFSENMAILEDYRHTEVDRIVGKVINPLAKYGEEIKLIRQNLKNESITRKKQILNMRKLEKSKTPESSRQAEIQLHASTIDATRSANCLERCIIEFEGRRLKGIKEILTDFVQIEMLWHAKALETLSTAYNSLQILNTKTDLIDFRNTLIRSGGNLKMCGPDPLDYYSSPPSQRKTKTVSSSSTKSGNQSKGRKNKDQPPLQQHQPHQNIHMPNYNNDDITSLFTEDDEEHIGIKIDNHHNTINDRAYIHNFNHQNMNEISDFNNDVDVDEDEDEEKSVEAMSDQTHSLSNSPHQMNNHNYHHHHSPLKSALKRGISKP